MNKRSLVNRRLGPMVEAGVLELRFPDRLRSPKQRYRARQDPLPTNQCAVCGFDVYLGKDLIGVDAAHIRWHQYDGPDSIANGLALCKLHHDALDRGAIGLFAATSDGFRLTVSNRIKGVSEAFRQLMDANGRPIRKPAQLHQMPCQQFVDWHSENVFKGEPRGF